MVDRGWRGIRYSYVQVVVSPRLGDPPPSLFRKHCHYLMGKGVKNPPEDLLCQMQLILHSQTVAPPAWRQTVILPALFVVICQKLGGWERMCASGVGQRWSTGISSTQGRRKQHTRLRRVKPTMETARLSTEWPPNAAGNGLLLCLMSSSLNGIYLINSCAS